MKSGDSIAMDDDPNADVAEQGTHGDQDLPPNVERERAQQTGGERGKLRTEDREDGAEGRASDR